MSPHASQRTTFSGAPSLLVMTAVALVSESVLAGGPPRRVERPALQAGQQATTSTIHRTVVLPAAGEASFRYFVDSEQGYDFLRVRLDGAVAFQQSGSVRAGTSKVSIPAGSHSLQFEYAKDGSVDRGLDTAWIDDLLISAPGLAESCEFNEPTLSVPPGWSGGGFSGGWTVSPAATPGAIGRPNQHSALGYQQAPTSSSVVSSPFYWASAGYLKFSYLVDSEANYDYLRVYLDNTTLVFSESGSWKTGRKSIDVPQGWHTIKFEYSKDVSVDSGMDTALVDDLELGTKASGVFATPDLDGLDPDQTPDGWTATGYGGGWRTRGAVKPEVLLYEGNITPTPPQVDGLIYTPGAHEYRPDNHYTKLGLYDFGPRHGPPTSLTMVTNWDTGTVYFALIASGATRESGDESGSVTLHIDAAHAVTIGAGYGVKDGRVPTSEDRKIVLDYSIPRGQATGTVTVTQYAGTGNAAGCWTQVTGLLVFPVQASVQEQPPEPELVGSLGRFSLEFSVRLGAGRTLSDIISTRRGGFGLTHVNNAYDSVPASYQQLPSIDGAVLDSCDTSTWQSIQFATSPTTAKVLYRPRALPVGLP